MSIIKKREQGGFAFLTVLILIYLCSCVSGGIGNHSFFEKRPYAYLTNSAKYVLLAPEGIEKPMDMAQYISASYGGQDYFFNAWVKADETGMDIALFNELGAAMGDLSYRDGAVNFSSQVLPESLAPEYIVADFQLCFYDPIPLGRALKKCGLTLETRGAGSSGTRRVLTGKNLVIEIEKTRDAIKLTNHLRGYSYTLKGDTV